MIAHVSVRSPSGHGRERQSGRQAPCQESNDPTIYDCTLIPLSGRESRVFVIHNAEASARVAFKIGLRIEIVHSWYRVCSCLYPGLTIIFYELRCVLYVQYLVRPQLRFLNRMVVNNGDDGALRIKHIVRSPPRGWTSAC